MLALRSYLLRYPQFVLILCILLLYTPFFFEPILRPAGDEKVYIAQALEMQEKGTWFLQWLAGEQNYHKGPAFYLLLRLGFLFFGTASMWSVLYMNLLGLLMSALAMYGLFARFLKQCNTISLFAALSYSYSVGLFFHMFASQMEALQVAFYTFTLYFLCLSESHESRPWHHFGLWLCIGFLGLLKSPIYSVLPGISVLFVWASKKIFFTRIKNPMVFSSVLSGVMLGIIGFAPALIWDQQNFIDTYIIRETLNKGSNSVPWYASALPPFTIYLFPWLFPGMLSLTVGAYLSIMGKLKFSLEEKSFFLNGVMLALPTLIFFSVHPYRSEVYTLPVVPCTIGFFVILMEKIWIRKRALLQASFLSSGLLFVLFCTLIVYLHFLFDPFPIEWWPKWLTLACVCLTVISLTLLSYGVFKRKFENVTLLALSPVPFFLALTLFLHALGKRDFVDFASQIEKLGNTQNQSVSYLNIPRHTWSEWGALNMWLHHPVKGVHELSELKKVIMDGGALIVPERSYGTFLEEVHSSFPDVHYNVSKIRRWLVHGKTPKGDKRTVEQFLESRNLKDLERYDYWFSFASNPKA